MVDAKSVQAQLRRIKFNPNGWGRSEVKELPGILSPDEKIYECVNGTYEGGFALLVATDMRVLLVDKKPLNFLTVEDLRFDMINQMNYNHRLMGAYITIDTGLKTLRFTSWDQQRLRKLISHVQDRMSEIKRDAAEHQENQKHHLAAINQQLQSYLLAQHQQLMQFREQKAKNPDAEIELPKPSPELADYLFAQSLLSQYGEKPAAPQKQQQPQEEAVQAEEPVKPQLVATRPVPKTEPSPDLYLEGYQEIFGKRPGEAAADRGGTGFPDSPQGSLAHLAGRSFEVNPLAIAYAKLPMMLRNRKFGRPNAHAPSQPSMASQP